LITSGPSGWRAGRLGGIEVDVEVAMLRPGGRSNGEFLTVTVCLLAAVAIGSVWTGMAVADGAMATMLIRFTISLVGGFYYVMLYRLARRRTLAAHECRTS
jgi:hypothetical protein